MNESYPNLELLEYKVVDALDLTLRKMAVPLPAFLRLLFFRSFLFYRFGHILLSFQLTSKNQ